MFRHADWTGLGTALGSVDWNFMFSETDPVEAFSLKILNLSQLFIPRDSILLAKGLFSWITSECRVAIRRKCEALGTPEFLDESRKCSVVLQAAFERFVVKTKMLDSSTTSKKW